MFKESYQEIISGEKLFKNHPGKEAHKKIAEKVINFLNEVNNGKTI